MRTKTLTEVRKAIRTGAPFSITFMKFDEKRSTGGERETFEKCILVKASDESEPKEPVLVTLEKKKVMPKDKNPHHLVHGTFNVRLLNMQVRKIHWLLIQEFNGMQVIL